MKEATVNTLNMELKVAGLPETAEEFDTMAGRENACVEAAINQYLYHTYLTVARKAIVEKLEEVTGFKRKKTTDGEKTVNDETEAEYINRLEAYLAENESSLEDYIDDVQTALPTVDLTKQRRGPSNKAPAKTWISQALELAKQVGIARVNEVLGFEIPEDASLADEKNQEHLYALAHCLRTKDAEIKKQAKQKMLASFAG